MNPTTSRERFHATVDRKPVDRPASWLGIPAHSAVPALLDHFGVPDLDSLRLKLGDDVYPVELPYHSLIREFVWPGTRRLVAQAKEYGLKVIHHSCGAIQELIPDLVEMGVDVIHPIQALATGMSAEELHAKFADRVSFCGGVDAQNLLVSGTPDAVASRVCELAALFPTGLVISPSHEAILPDIAPANIEAFFMAMRSINHSQAR